MPESNTHDGIMWMCQYSPNTERAIKLDKSRGVQSADLAGSSLHGKMPESDWAPPSGQTGSSGDVFIKGIKPGFPHKWRPSAILGILPLFECLGLVMSKSNQNAARSSHAYNYLKRPDPLRPQNGIFYT